MYSAMAMSGVCVVSMLPMSARNMIITLKYLNPINWRIYPGKCIHFRRDNHFKKCFASLLKRVLLLKERICSPETTLLKLFLPPFEYGSSLKGKQGSKFFHFRVDPFS